MKINMANMRCKYSDELCICVKNNDKAGVETAARQVRALSPASVGPLDIRWCILLTNLHLIKLPQALKALWSVGPRLGQLPGS